MSIGRAGPTSWVGTVSVSLSSATRESPRSDHPADGETCDDAYVIADARIDNDGPLKAALQTAPASLGTLLIQAYRRWGDDFVGRLRGDFAILIWDRRNRTLLVARDQFGVRPVFFRRSGQEARFATSVRKLLVAGDENHLDDERVVEYLLGRWRARGSTFFRHVRELPAGHVLVADERRLAIRRYWRPDSEPVSGRRTKSEYYSEFQRLFVQSVRDRLESDTAAVIHVSGGLDSSSVAGAADLLQQHGLSVPELVGAGAHHPALSCDERPFIDAVAQRVRFPIRRWDGTASIRPDPDLVDPSPVQPGLRALHRGGTTGDLSIAADHRAPVILAGMGGDELGAAVGITRDLIADFRWARALDELLFFPGATMRTRGIRFKQLILPTLPRAVVNRYERARAWVPPWIAPAYQGLARELAMTGPRITTLSSSLAADAWDRMTSARLGRAVTQFQEHAYDRGISYRFPFLNVDLLLFTLSIPYDCWPAPRAFTRLHRQALAELLPEVVRRRFSKAEFSVALINRIRRATTVIRTLLDDSNWCSGRYVDPIRARAFCRSMLSTNSSPSVRDWLALWAVITLEAWLRKKSGYHLADVEVS